MGRGGGLGEERERLIVLRETYLIDLRVDDNTCMSVERVDDNTCHVRTKTVARA